MTYDCVILSGIQTIGFERTCGPYVLCSYLNKNGFKTKVLPILSFFDLQKIKNVVEKYVTSETLLLGISSNFLIESFEKDQNQQKPIMTANLKNKGLILGVEYNDWIDFINFIRKLNFNIKIVLGGYQSFSRPPGVDFYIDGYAEDIILDLMVFLKYHQNKNLIFKKTSNNSAVLSSKSRLYNFTLEKLEYDSLGYNEVVLPIEISRGCIFKCAFCSYPLNGKKKYDYIKNFEVLKQEFFENYEKHNVQKYLFMDDTLNDSIYKIKSLRKVFDSLSFDITFDSYMRLDLLARFQEMIHLLKGNVDNVFFGIESINNKSAKLIGKGYEFKKLIEVAWKVKDQWKCNITVSFIIGLPYDSESDVEKLKNFLLSEENPFDSWLVNPLYISNNKNKLYKSLFQINHEKFGYHFNDNNTWYNLNNNMNFSRATELANSVMNFTIDKNRYVAWVFASLYNLGFSKQDCLLKFPLRRQLYNNNEIKDKKKIVTEQIYQFLLNN